MFLRWVIMRHDFVVAITIMCQFILVILATHEGSLLRKAVSANCALLYSEQDCKFNGQYSKFLHLHENIPYTNFLFLLRYWRQKFDRAAPKASHDGVQRDPAPHPVPTLHALQLPRAGHVQDTGQAHRPGCGRHQDLVPK